jgi:hypothetical protein
MLHQYSGAPTAKLELRTKKKSANSYYCGNVIASLRLMLLMWGDHFGWSDHFRSCRNSDHFRSFRISDHFRSFRNSDHFRSFRNSDHFQLSGHSEFPSFRPLEADIVSHDSGSSSYNLHISVLRACFCGTRLLVLLKTAKMQVC